MFNDDYTATKDILPDSRPRFHKARMRTVPYAYWDNAYYDTVAFKSVPVNRVVPVPVNRVVPADRE